MTGRVVCKQEIPSFGHKDLRYVLAKYDGTQNLAELIAEVRCPLCRVALLARNAAQAPQLKAKEAPALEGRTEGCMPGQPKG